MAQPIGWWLHSWFGPKPNSQPSYERDHEVGIYLEAVTKFNHKNSIIFLKTHLKDTWRYPFQGTNTTWMQLAGFWSWCRSFVAKGHDAYVHCFGKQMSKCYEYDLNLPRFQTDSYGMVIDLFHQVLPDMMLTVSGSHSEEFSPFSPHSSPPQKKVAKGDKLIKLPSGKLT